MGDLTKNLKDEEAAKYTIRKNATDIEGQDNDAMVMDNGGDNPPMNVQNEVAATLIGLKGSVDDLKVSVKQLSGSIDALAKTSGGDDDEEVGEYALLAGVLDRLSLILYVIAIVVASYPRQVMLRSQLGKGALAGSTRAVFWHFRAGPLRCPAGHPAAIGLFLGPAGPREELNSELNSTRVPLTKRHRDLTVRTPRGTPPVAGSPPGHICYVTDQMNRIKTMPARLLSPAGASRGYIPDGHRDDFAVERTGAGPYGPELGPCVPELNRADRSWIVRTGAALIRGCIPGGRTKSRPMGIPIVKHPEVTHFDALLKMSKFDEEKALPPNDLLPGGLAPIEINAIKRERREVYKNRQKVVLCVTSVLVLLLLVVGCILLALYLHGRGALVDWVPSSIVTTGSVLSLTIIDYRGLEPGQSLVGLHGYLRPRNTLVGTGVKEAIYERMYNPTLNREGGYGSISPALDFGTPSPEDRQHLSSCSANPTLWGRVAQSAARSAHTQEVAGSNPAHVTDLVPLGKALYTNFLTSLRWKGVPSFVKPPQADYKTVTVCGVTQVSSLGLGFSRRKNREGIDSPLPDPQKALCLGSQSMVVSDNTEPVVTLEDGT
ncbi:hypothetical protein Bbelb_100540 [Branchiostoma belcheri]|nr:hypothetical protein Bbelb_100540 [Branchiostoma belcheri]